MHTDLSARQRRDRTVELFEAVGLPNAADRVNAYPHQMSGGQCQRVMIAMAIACNPKLLIADEPTTALDVTIQAEILALMDRLKRETGTAVMFITHDMAVVAQMADLLGCKNRRIRGISQGIQHSCTPSGGAGSKRLAAIPPPCVT